MHRVHCINMISYRQETKTSSTRSEEEHSPNFYDEIDKFSTDFSKAVDDNNLRDEIVFDAATNCVESPNEAMYDIAGTCVHTHNEGTFDNVPYICMQSSEHQSAVTKPAHDGWKFQCNYEVMSLKNNA